MNDEKDLKEKMGNNFVKMIKSLVTQLKQDIGYAVEFPKNGQWLNTSKPLTLDRLKGHIVLLDFWTYCCINCIHVLDDLKYLEKKYKNDPFLVIGIHSPKFKNEKDIDNVRSAVARYEISHPVLIDNEHYLWEKYGVNAWPSFVLIGPEGRIVGKTAGEGKRFMLDNSIEDGLREGKEKGVLADKPIEIESDIKLDSFLRFPGKIDIDPKEGILYVSDSNHDRILKVLLEEDNTGKIVSIIGGENGYKDGSFKEARFNKPQGLSFKDGLLYIADTENHTIRVINFEKNIVKTIAGTGKKGDKREYKGNPLKVSLNSPWDIEIYNDYLYIAMAGTHQIWRLNLKLNIIENFAGSGKENIIDGELNKAALAQPSGLSVDKEGNKLFFADSEVSGLRYVNLNTNKVISLIGKGLFQFGLKNGNFNEALLQHPLGLEYYNNKIYLADTYNHALRVADLNSQKIRNLIYRPKKGVCKIGDNDCDELPLYEPNDVKYFSGKLYIADTNNHLIRIFDLKLKNITDLYLYQ